MISIENFLKNLRHITSQIQESSARSQRSIEEINIIAVTKTLPVKAWEFASSRSLTIGENRVQETQKKFALFNNKKNINLHYIGHLQRNKVKIAIQIFDVIQTIDSLKLAQKINVQAKEQNQKQKVFLKQ